MTTKDRKARISFVSRFFLPLILLLIAMPLGAVTCNGETVNGRMPNIPNPAYPDYWQFGSHVYARTHISSTDCDYHATKNAYTGTYSVYPTGETSDAYYASTHSQDNLGRPIDLISNVNALQSQFGANLYALRRNYGTTNADGSLGDILWLDKPGAAFDEITDIPVEYCFSYDSMWAFSTAPISSAGNSLVQFGKFNYNGYASQDSYDLDTQLTAADTGPGGGNICTNGYLRMSGPGAGYTVRLSFNLTGQSGNELDSGTGTYMVTIEGGISSDLKITSLPDGVSCRSASGVFPGCDGEKPDLAITNVRITQAVFGSDFNKDGRTDLVKDRDTAILVDVELLKGEVGDNILIGGQYTDSLDATHEIGEQRFSFDQNSNEKVVPLFFTPTKEELLKDLLITVNQDKIDIEANKENNTYRVSDFADVHETINLVVPNVPLSQCNGSGQCYGPLQEFQQHVVESNDFMETVYPVANGGYNGPTVIDPANGSDFGTVERNRIEIDLVNAFHMAVSKYGDAKAAVAIVPDGYFEYHDIPARRTCCTKPDGSKSCHIGARVDSKDIKAVLVQEGYWTATAHEIGHLIGKFPAEAYKENPICGEPGINPPDIHIDGYWVEGKQELSNAVDFMGTGSVHQGLHPSPARWVSTEHWESLLSKLSEHTPDPEMISIGAIFNIDGSAEFLPWYTMNGTPTLTSGTGDYQVKLSDVTGETIESYNFDLNFNIYFFPHAKAPSKTSAIAFTIPYSIDTSSITFLAPDGSVIFKVDPVYKLLNDAVNNIGGSCINPDGLQYRDALINNMQALEELLNSFNFSAAIAHLQDPVVYNVDMALISQCDAANPLATTKEKLLGLIDNSIVRLQYRISH